MINLIVSIVFNHGSPFIAKAVSKRLITTLYKDFKNFGDFMAFFLAIFIPPKAKRKVLIRLTISLSRT